MAQILHKTPNVRPHKEKQMGHEMKTETNREPG